MTSWTVLFLLVVGLLSTTTLAQTTTLPERPPVLPERPTTPPVEFPSTSTIGDEDTFPPPVSDVLPSTGITSTTEASLQICESRVQAVAESNIADVGTVCNICGDGNVVTAPTENFGPLDGVMYICGCSDFAGQRGLIPEELCPRVVATIARGGMCGCAAAIDGDGDGDNDENEEENLNIPPPPPTTGKKGGKGSKSGKRDSTAGKSQPRTSIRTDPGYRQLRFGGE
ncbi:hypothetical protein IV203_021636 [Nitzschia inconspicua]|uniref:Uncharacterized protein n=1 Tax=Nitzschia inconspicua TaxID=303405 RepID=A0A9K3KH52_9STRA|nr:hypothetical protein IV203_021636 [Nitzschia inconspicua]